MNRQQSQNADTTCVSVIIAQTEFKVPLSHYCSSLSLVCSAIAGSKTALGILTALVGIIWQHLPSTHLASNFTREVKKKYTIP